MSGYSLFLTHYGVVEYYDRHTGNASTACFIAWNAGDPGSVGGEMFPRRYHEVATNDQPSMFSIIRALLAVLMSRVPLARYYRLGVSGEFLSDRVRGILSLLF